jgi:exopolysaccharide biosynthesis polyprenyl glycosylphosphotransferase
VITYRLRGLVNLHIVATALVATGYFLFMATGVRFIPFLDLSPDLNVPLYAVVIFVGMLVSARFWTHFGSRFHVMTWVDAAHISSRQIVVVALLIFTLIVATKDATISRLFLASYLVSCAAVLVVVNRTLPARLARAAFHQAHQIPTVFVGAVRTVAKLNPWVHQKEHLGVRVMGILSDDSAPQPTAQSGPWLGTSDRLADVVETRGVGQVILLEIPDDPARMASIVETCQQSGCRLLVYHDLLDRVAVQLTPVVEGKHLFLTAREEPLEDPFNRAMKRVFDIAVALPVVALVLPPLCLAVWAVQRVQSPGPMLFARPRGGQQRREFYMLKFRSMHAAPPDKEREAQQARAGDNRIYPFGAFLRKTSLDEFPQFWNVLVGEMSIVGPRPHLPKHDEEFSRVAKTYRTRHLVKPGITGLAQVNGYRGEITDPELLERRVEMDIEYITSWSIWLDVQITAKTFLHVFLPPKTAR